MLAESKATVISSIVIVFLLARGSYGLVEAIVSVAKSLGSIVGFLMGIL